MGVVRAAIFLGGNCPGFSKPEVIFGGNCPGGGEGGGANYPGAIALDLKQKNYRSVT